MRRTLVAAAIGFGTIACPATSATSALAGAPAPATGADRLPVPFEIAEDPGGTWSIDDVTDGAASASFRPPDRATPNLGLSSSAWWLRFRLPPTTRPEGEERILGVGWALVDEAKLYVPSADGGHAIRVSGRSVALGDRDVAYRQPAFRLAHSDTTRPYYLRLAGDGTMIVPLELFSRRGFEAKRRDENVLLGGFFGVLIVMATFGALAFAFLRESTFLWYAAMVAGFALWQASAEGLPSSYVWSGAPAWTSRALHLFGLLFGTCAIVFARAYLSTRERLPSIDRWMIPAGLWVVVALALWALVAPGPMLVRAVVVVTVLASVWAVVASVESLRRGYRPARYFVSAWLVGCVAAIAQALRAVGWLPSNLFTDFGLQAAVLLTFVTLSLGIVDRMVGMRGDLHRREEEVRRLEREDAAQRTFLATVSHDLRQPLHAVGLLLGALRTRLVERESVSLLEKVQSATREMGDMFNALLDMSRLDAGLVQAQPTAVALGPLVEHLADEFAVQARSQGLDFSAEAADVTVRTDPLLLSRILRNLLTNALRYTDRGRIAISAEITDDEVAITVADTGRGIPEAAQARVFEPFQRGGPEGRATADDALGLGLAIVHRLAGLLGHPVTLQSSLGRGTRVTVRLARLAAEIPAPPLEATRDAAVTTGSGAGRTLVVDDDATVLAGMRAQLESWGYEVATAATREEAFAVTREWTPDVIFVDHHLAGGDDGVAVVEALRARLGRDVPALIVSGDTSADAVDAARSHGLPFLAKPVLPSRLRRALDHVRRGGGRGA